MNLLTSRIIIFIAVVSLFAWWSARALLDYNTHESQSPLALIPESTDLTLKNINQTKIHAGESLWTVVAESATQSKEDGILLLNNVQLSFFDKKARKTEITADHGSLMPQYQKMIFSSNVVMTNPSGNTLQTEYLEYDEISNIFHTEKMVIINVDSFIVRGVGMQIDVENRTLMVLSDVKVSGTLENQ